MVNGIDCCGCSACMAICPTNAISMQENEKGFEVPTIDTALCVSCGLCDKVCAFQAKKDVANGSHRFAVAARHKEEPVRAKSRSGGAFMAIAKWIIEQQGVVYGVAITPDLQVEHQRADTLADCAAFQGSKYVQSKLQNCMKLAAQDLKDGKYVLFSGTACQIGGLLSFLNLKHVPTDKLVTCDLVCHGVAGPKMFRDYCSWLAQKYKKPVSDFNFRDKSVGWSQHVESYVVDNKKQYNNAYTQLYYCGADWRNSCYECHYTSVNRVSDFTLADCWGAEHKLPELFDNKGISLLLVNTPKAEKIYGDIAGMLSAKTVSIEDFMQPQLQHPPIKSPEYDQFWDMYLNQGFDAIVKRYGKQDLQSRAKRWVKWNLLKKY